MAVGYSYDICDIIELPMLSVLSREYLLVFHVVFIVYCLFVVLRLGSEVGILCFALARIGAEVSAMRIQEQKERYKKGTPL
jgi:hypothetical protein